MGLEVPAAFEAGPTADDLEALGALMYASHASYSACGLGTDGTDRLVELVREAGPQRGLYGAKITGGGAGGTVAILGSRRSYSEVRRIARQYQDETGRRAAILGGSSPGSLQFGLMRIIDEGD
jgi:L-arabinokinase